MPCALALAPIVKGKAQRVVLRHHRPQAPRMARDGVDAFNLRGSLLAWVLDGNPVEDEAGKEIRNQTANPVDPVIVSTPATSTTKQKLEAKGPFGNPGSRLFYKNLPAGVPPPGD